MTPCPNGDGYYMIDEKSVRENRDDKLIGWPVAGRFVVTDLLGRGSMAKVYRAHQTQVERDVALKLFSRENLIEKNLSQGDREAAINMAKERFVQEAKVLARLQHPNCVTLYDFGASADNEFLFIAMELVQGVSLRTAANRRLKFPAILEIAQQVLLALREAHGVGIIHRDLKPENVILSLRPGSDEQVVKVVDFGIARMLGATTDGHTMVGTLFGTPAYMSPEQCRGESQTVGPHSDIYSLGCVLYELLCGKLPYEASTPQEMLRCHIEHLPPPVIVRAGIRAPLEFVDFVSKCLQKQPTARYEDAHSALVALDALAGATNSTSEHMRRTAVLGSNLKPAKVLVPSDRVRGDEIAPPVGPIQEIEPVQPMTGMVRQQSASGSGSVYETHPDGTLKAPKVQRDTTPYLIMGGMALIAVICFLVLFLIFKHAG